MFTNTLEGAAAAGGAAATNAGAATFTSGLATMMARGLNKKMNDPDNLFSGGKSTPWWADILKLANSNS